MSDDSFKPFYHLRPNKNIDRHLFIKTLIELNKVLSCDLSKYIYTGFGSYMFDDFKLLYKVLNISRMISLESDELVFKRAKFNCPYKFIKIINKTSTDYLETFSSKERDHNIFWLDFTAPSDLGKQLTDYISLLKKLKNEEIIRITLNANVSSLGKKDGVDDLQEYRFNKLKEKISEENIPEDISSCDMIRQKYPYALLKILRKITNKELPNDSDYHTKFMLPIFSSVYSDGQPMLTFMGIILDSQNNGSYMSSKIKKELKKDPHNLFSWEKACRIVVPELSVREIIEINQRVHYPHAKTRLKKQYPFLFENNDDKLDSYIKYYKFYPNYHLVSF